MSKVETELNLYMLPIINGDIVRKSNFDIAVSPYAQIGKISMGYNYYVDQSYEILNRTKKSIDNRDFYKVLNPFELYIGDVNKKDEFQLVMKKYFGIKNDIDNNVFLHIWEILTIFNMMTHNMKININSYVENVIKEGINAFAKKISNKKVDYVDKDMDILIIINEFPNEILYKESIMFKTVISNIYEGLKTLKSGGKMILRLNDIYTMPTLKMLELCKYLFENVYIYKPYYSRSYESENYVICSIFNKSEFEEIKERFGKSVELMKKAENMFIVDFMGDKPFDTSFEKVMTYINIIMGGAQHKATNRIIKYVNDNNYYGEEYQDAVEKQILGMKYYINKFFPKDENEYMNNQKEFIVEMKEQLNKMKKLI